MSIADKLTTIAENVPKVFDAGKDAEYDKFWDGFQQNGNRGAYRYAFYDNYPDEIFNPKYPFTCTGNCSSMFQYAKMSKIEQTVDFSANTMGAAGSVFANTNNLETISDLRVKSGLSMASWFTKATALKNITITGEIDLDVSFVDCPLTVESMNNIISCLKDYSAIGGTHTLTLKSDRLTMLTDKEKKVATDKGWTFAWN